MAKPKVWDYLIKIQDYTFKLYGYFHDYSLEEIKKKPELIKEFKEIARLLNICVESIPLIVKEDIQKKNSFDMNLIQNIAESIRNAPNNEVETICSRLYVISKNLYKIRGFFQCTLPELDDEAEYSDVFPKS